MTPAFPTNNQQRTTSNWLKAKRETAAFRRLSRFLNSTYTEYQLEHNSYANYFFARSHTESVFFPRFQHACLLTTILEDQDFRVDKHPRQAIDR